MIISQLMVKNKPVQIIASTGEIPVSSTKDEVIKEAKRIEESTLYSTRGHFTASRIWGNFHIGIGLLISILSAIAASLTFADGHYIVVGSLSLIVMILSGVATFLNPNEKANNHKIAGDKHYALNNRARVFWTIDCWEQEATDQILTQKLRDLSESKIKTNSESPQIPRWAYLLAKKGIEAGEADFAVDKKVG